MTVQGPVEEQQPDGMSHTGGWCWGGGGGARVSLLQAQALGLGTLSSPTPPLNRGALGSDWAPGVTGTGISG